MAIHGWRDLGLIVGFVLRYSPYWERVREMLRSGAFGEIVSGLATGDEVVAKAGAYVRDGDRINPVHGEQASATK